MGQYSEHLRILVLALFALLGLLLLTSLFGAGSFQSALIYSITILVLSLLILARFGGDLGRTL